MRLQPLTVCVYKRVLCEFSGVDAKGDPHIVLMVFDQAIHCADAHLKCEHKAHRKVSARGVCAFTCDMPIPRSDKLCHYKVVSLSDVMCIMSRVAFGALCINDPIANAPTAVVQMRISIQHIGVVYSKVCRSKYIASTSRTCDSNTCLPLYI